MGIFGKLFSKRADPDSERIRSRVISPDLEGPKLGDKIQFVDRQEILHGLQAPKLGDKFQFGGQEWTLKKAYTRELEVALNCRYYQDCVTDTVGNVAKVLSVIRSGDSRRDLKAMAETWRRLNDLIKRFDTETRVGGVFINDTVEADGRMFVDPGLIKLIREQPGSEALETALYVAFPTPDAKRGLYEQWASIIKNYQDQRNTEELLREKSTVLATFIIYNLDIALDVTTAFNAESPKLSDEQKTSIRLEGAALWHRVIDELSQKYLCQEQLCLFMDNLLYNFAFILALQGYSPHVMPAALVNRIKEYSQYKEWGQVKGKGAAGTLFWEAGKHILEPTACIGPWHNTSFAIFFLHRLKVAFVYELLTGRSDRLKAKAQE